MILLPPRIRIPPCCASALTDVMEGGAAMWIRTGSVSLANGPGNDFCGSGVDGSNIDGLGDNCSLLGDTSRSRESSCKRCWWSMCNIARHSSSVEPDEINARANSDSSGILTTPSLLQVTNELMRRKAHETSKSFS